MLLDRLRLTDSNGSVLSPPWLAYGVLRRGSSGVPGFSLNCLIGSTGGFLGGVVLGGVCLAVGALPVREV